MKKPTSKHASQKVVTSDTIPKTAPPKIRPGSPSMRTTFTLSKSTNEGLRQLSEYSGISEKDLLESIVVEPCILNGLDDDDHRGIEVLRNALLLPLAATRGQALQRKTRVVNKRTINELERLAAKYKVHRDLMLEYLLKSSLNAYAEVLGNELQCMRKALKMAEDFHDLAEDFDYALTKLCEESGTPRPCVSASALVDSILEVLSGEVWHLERFSWKPSAQ